MDLGGLCAGPWPPFDLKQPPVPASDGSVWIWGTCESWVPNYSLLVHVDAAGTVTRTLQHPEADRYGNGSALALDEHGDPWLATIEHNGADVIGGRLQRYSSDLEPVGEPFVFEGWHITQMENVPGYGFAFSGDSYGYDRFGLIDDAGHLLWTNEDPWGAVPGLAAASTGQIAVAATRRPYASTDPRDPMNILVYGPDGVRRWTLELPLQLSGAVSEPGWVQLKSDAEGNLFAGGSGNPNPGYSLFLQKLSADGVPEWLWQLDGQPWYTVEPATGRVFVSGAGPLIEITADGESCRRHPYPYSDIALRHLVFSPTGELFFTSTRSVGRFRRIEP